MPRDDLQPSRESTAQVCTCSGGGQAPGPAHIKGADERCVWWHRWRANR